MFVVVCPGWCPSVECWEEVSVDSVEVMQSVVSVSPAQDVLADLPHPGHARHGVPPVGLQGRQVSLPRQ